METQVPEQDSYARWRFLYENPALKRPGWLPPAAEVPELADLRAEHERLRVVESGALDDYRALQARRDAEEEARRAAQESEFLGRGPAELAPITVTDDDIADARVRAEAARDAFQTFVRQTVGQVRERAGVLADGLSKIEGDAQEMERAAEALLAEADRLKASTLRLRAWLERVTGKSPLGHIAWTDLPAPVPAKPMTVAELHEAAVPAWGSVELVGSDDSAAFGTDDPDDLDPDSAAARPWEVAIDD